MADMTPITLDQVHQSLQDVIEDEFMYDFYSAPDPSEGDVAWHIAWNGLRKNAAIVRASSSPIVKVRWIDASSAELALSTISR